MRQDKPKPEDDEGLTEIVIGHGRCTYLLLSLLCLILLHPYAEGALFGRIAVTILYSLVLIGGAYAIGGSQFRSIIGIGLALLGAALQWTALLTDTTALTRVATVVYIAFLLLTIGEVLQYLMKKGPITADKLHGAVAGYIMLAFVWAFIYSLIESFAPNSFRFPAEDAGSPRPFYHFLYFSFSTLSTVGYGDITPVTDPARSFVMIEEFAGVFFVGILIARLAGLYPASDNRTNRSP